MDLNAYDYFLPEKNLPKDSFLILNNTKVLPARVEMKKEPEEEGIKKYFVALHVGLGTFAPVTEENLKKKKFYE